MPRSQPSRRHLIQTSAAALTTLGFSSGAGPRAAQAADPAPAHPAASRGICGAMRRRPQRQGWRRSTGFRGWCKIISFATCARSSGRDTSAARQ